MKIYLTGLVFCSLMISSCNDTKKEVVIESPKVESRKLGELKIAFYEQDSMKLHFEYYKKQDSLLSKKQLAFQGKLNEKRKSMETYYMSYMQKAQSNLLSQVEAEAYQRNLQNQEAELMKYQEEQGGKLEKESISLNEAIFKKIDSFSKSFCEKNNIDLLLIHGPGGQFNYISPEMDVTNDFVAFLNESQAEIENDLKK